MNSQRAFGIVAAYYAVANLASMGLELSLRETIKSLRSARLVVLTLVWGWVEFAGRCDRMNSIGRGYVKC